MSDVIFMTRWTEWKNIEYFKLKLHQKDISLMSRMSVAITTTLVLLKCCVFFKSLNDLVIHYITLLLCYLSFFFKSVPQIWE
jgi:hypothetical protein